MCFFEDLIAPVCTLSLLFRGAWHCVAQHFQSAAQRNAKLPRRPILRPVEGDFPIYLGLGVYGHWWGGGDSFTKSFETGLSLGLPGV